MSAGWILLCMVPAYNMLISGVEIVWPVHLTV